MVGQRLRENALDAIARALEDEIRHYYEPIGENGEGNSGHDQ